MCVLEQGAAAEQYLDPMVAVRLRRKLLSKKEVKQSMGAFCQPLDAWTVLLDDCR
jgi:hypothetical protein